RHGLHPRPAALRGLPRPREQGALHCGRRQRAAHAGPVRDGVRRHPGHRARPGPPRAHPAGLLRLHLPRHRRGAGPDGRDGDPHDLRADRPARAADLARRPRPVHQAVLRRPVVPAGLAGLHHRRRCHQPHPPDRPGHPVHVTGWFGAAGQLDPHRAARPHVRRRAPAAAAGDPERRNDAGVPAMNRTIKRTAVACLAMFGLLMINVNILQGVRAQSLSDDARNTRNFYDRYAVQRGRITAGGEVILAQSKETKGDFRFVREYPEGRLYAHVTGFFSPESESAIERSENSLLDGSSADLLLQRGIDLFTGEPTRGANVDLTIDPAAQKAAFDALRQSGKRGAVVALDPKTGGILAMVSLPTYDPAEL